MYQEHMGDKMELNRRQSCVQVRDDMNETSFVETTSAVDVASRVFGRNRPETTCMGMSCATLEG